MATVYLDDLFGDGKTETLPPLALVLELKRSKTILLVELYARSRGSEADVTVAAPCEV